MRIAICEDEQIFAQELATHLRTFFQTKNIEPSIVFFADEEAALKMCQEVASFDIIFMDVNLGGRLDGVDISQRLRGQAPNIPILFITSLENRAIDGYDVNAFSFIIKKNFAEKLPLVLEKLWKRLYMTRTLTVTGRDEVHVLPVKDIIWIESDGRSSLIHTIEADYTDARSIQNLAPILSEADFIECFKSIFVNIEKIKSVNADTITLINNHKLPVSRRNRKRVMLAVMKKVRGQ